MMNEKLTNTPLDYLLATFDQLVTIDQVNLTVNIIETLNRQYQLMHDQPNFNEQLYALKHYIGFSYDQNMESKVINTYHDPTIDPNDFNRDLKRWLTNAWLGAEFYLDEPLIYHLENPNALADTKIQMVNVTPTQQKISIFD